MPQSTDYLANADECMQLAQRAQTSEHRIMLTHIAETWRRLADNSFANTADGDTGPGKRN